MHLNSILMFEAFGKKHFSKEKSVLEIGPDKYPSSTFKSSLGFDTVSWHTLEIDPDREMDKNNKEHIISKDGYNYPINENTYDIIFSAQVFEHVADIEKWMNELKRILKPNGLLITISPATWPYHLAPIDCWRLYPEAFKVLAEHLNMEIVGIHFDSLELNEELVKQFPKSLIIPGKSFNHVDSERVIKKKIFWNKIAIRLPYFKELLFSIQVSYDVVSIFRKK